MSKVMLITGASRGIGAATAILAAKSGFDVAINYHNSHQAANDIAEIARSHGAKAHAIRADVTDPREVEQLFGQVDQIFGRLDVLVNNAGVLEMFSVAQSTREKVRRLFEANVFSLFDCCREAIARMSTEQGGQGGVIINVSSVAARLGDMYGVNAYASSKAAVDRFTISLAFETGPAGIRVNAVRPGIIATDMQNAIRGDISEAASIAQRTTSMGRIGQPEEVAQTIVWLASDAASYVHGAILDVSGGR